MRPVAPAALCGAHTRVQDCRGTQCANVMNIRLSAVFIVVSRKATGQSKPPGRTQFAPTVRVAMTGFLAVSRSVGAIMNRLRGIAPGPGTAQPCWARDMPAIKAVKRCTLIGPAA